MKKLLIKYIIMAVILSLSSVLLFMQFDLPVLDIISSMLFISCVILLFLSLFQIIYGTIKYYKSKSTAPSKRAGHILIIYITLFFSFGFLEITSGAIINKKVRAHIRDVLNQMDINDVAIKINGIETKKREILFKCLQKLQYMDNKGGRKHRVQCEISDGRDKMLLVLSQSAIFDNAYVVFYPKYRSTRSNVVGGFYSDSIDLTNP